MSEWIWAFVAGAAVAAWAGVRIHGDRLKHRLAAERERMLHDERLAAIREGTWADLGLDIAGAHAPHREPGIDGQALARHLALAAGLVLCFGGVGYVTGTALVPETRETLGMTELAPLGLIPALAGMGLLLYVYLTRERRA